MQNKTLEELEADLTVLEYKLEQKKKAVEDDLKILKQKEAEIIKLRNNLNFKDFDKIMRKYYTHRLPENTGKDLTILHNYWNNNQDESDMRGLFNYAEMDRYRTYNVAELLWESGCAEDWLEQRGVSERTIKGLGLWYDLHFPEYLSEEEKEYVQEYMRLFYNIICDSCVCDW